MGQHTGMKSHIGNCKIKLTPLQLKLCKADVNQPQDPSTSGSVTVALGSTKTAAIKAELYWAVKSVLSNYSLNSCSDINQQFNVMFSSRVPKDFSLSPTKLMYLITEALRPYFWGKLKEDVKAFFYTICFDETTNKSSQKELQGAIRYWSDTELKIVQRHLQTFFIGSAKAEDLHNKILAAIQKADIQLRNLIMIGCDGSNVNKKLIRMLNESVLDVRSKGLINIGLDFIFLLPKVRRG